MRTITVGSESTGPRVPVVDGVRARLTDVTENKFNANRLDFWFTLIDVDYDDENNDEEDNAIIRDLSSSAYVHYETVNLPEGSEKLSKKTKFYKLLKGMSGGKDIEEDTEIDLEDYIGRDYLLDFEHVEKKGGPPNFEVVPGVYKSQVAKIRPVRKARKAAPQQQLQQALEPDDASRSDDDLLNDEE